MSRIGETIIRELIHKSPIITTEEVATASGVRKDSASSYLAKLAHRDVITRVSNGIWADARHPNFSAYAVVPYLLGRHRQNQGGYVSLLSALNLRGMIEQIPQTIHIISLRRHRPMRTPVGVYEFHQIDPVLFGGSEPFGQFGNFELATATKALFDVIYLSVRRGRRLAYLPEVELTPEFKVTQFQEWVRRIPYPRLQVAVNTRWREFQRTLSAEANRVDWPIPS